MLSKPRHSLLNLVSLSTIAFVCVVLANCGGAGSAPGPQEFVYTVAAQGTDTSGSPILGIAGFSVGASGQLNRISGSPFQLIPSSFAGGILLADPKSRFLFVYGSFGCDKICSGNATVLGLIGPNHEVTFREIPSQLGGAVLFDPLGRFIFAQGGHVYAIPSDLSFTEVSGSPFTLAGFSPEAVDPQGKFLVGADTWPSPPTLSVFNIAASGTLTPASIVQFTTLGVPGRAFFHPSGKFLFVEYRGIDQIDHLATFQIDSSGKLTLSSSNGNLSSAPIICASCAPPLSTNLLAIHPSGKFLYAFQCDDVTCDPSTSYAKPRIVAFAIDQTTGSVSLSPVFSMPVQWVAVALDASGERMFATKHTPCTESSSLVVVGVDTNSGRLTPAESADVGGCPDEIAVTH